MECVQSPPYARTVMPVPHRPPPRAKLLFLPMSRSASSHPARGPGSGRSALLFRFALEPLERSASTACGRSGTSSGTQAEGRSIRLSRLRAELRLQQSQHSFHPFEVKDCQVHLTFGEDVDGEDILGCGEMDFREGRSRVPVMPLAPGDGIGCVEG
jgi:hypothetical protein